MSKSVFVQNWIFQQIGSNWRVELSWNLSKWSYACQDGKYTRRTRWCEDDIFRQQWGMRICSGGQCYGGARPKISGRRMKEENQRTLKRGERFDFIWRVAVVGESVRQEQSVGGKWTLLLRILARPPWSDLSVRRRRWRRRGETTEPSSHISSGRSCKWTTGG